MPIAGPPPNPAVPGAPTWQEVVNWLFEPNNSPKNRLYFSLLIEQAGLQSAQAQLVITAGTYLATNAAGFLGGAAGVPTAAVTDRVTLLETAERTNMLSQLLNAWNPAWPAAGGVAPQPSDISLIRFLRNYIGDPTGLNIAAGAAFPPTANSYALYVPVMAYDGMLGTRQKFRLLRYLPPVALSPLGGGAWLQPGVTLLLDLMTMGAHFVVIHAAPNLPGGLGYAPASFFDLFNTHLGGQSRAALTHSHYSGAGGLTNIGAALTFPGLVNAETAPIPCPYICAFLTGRTAYAALGNPYNTFFQLEGWPTTGITNLPGRHGADYAAHTASLWNISTYGASLYSEKRGTTVFLAPQTWNPAPQAGTIMMPYAGAGTPQGWLDTSLIRT